MTTFHFEQTAYLAFGTIDSGGEIEVLQGNHTVSIIKNMTLCTYFTSDSSAVGTLTITVAGITIVSIIVDGETANVAYLEQLDIPLFPDETLAITLDGFLCEAQFTITSLDQGIAYSTD